VETFFERSDANQRSHRKKRFTSIKEEILENWKIRGFRIETPESKDQNRKSRKIQRTNRCQLKDRNFAARQRTDKKEWDS